jgi:hypothetical protein
MAAKKDRYALALGLASWWLATNLQDHEDDAERRRKMKRVCDQKLEAVQRAWPGETAELSTLPGAEKLLKGMRLARDTKRTLLIDLLFSDPFAPYELKFSQKNLRRALGQLAERMGLPGGTVDELADIRKDATKAHRKLSIGKIAAFGVAGVVVIGFGGWLAAPLIASYLGAGAGLAGATATAHGLALLGGGTVAAGGAGMAGGMIVVTGAGALAGGVGATGGALLFAMGAASAENELIKLQVTYKAVLLQNQAQTKKAQDVVKGLAQREREVRALLTEEGKLNEENSHKIKQLEEILESIEDSREWIKRQQQTT